MNNNLKKIKTLTSVDQHAGEMFDQYVGDFLINMMVNF